MRDPHRPVDGGDQEAQATVGGIRLRALVAFQSATREHGR